MADGENMALGFFKSIEEDRRLQAEEFQIRYAERKRQKQSNRDIIESTAVHICKAAEKAAEKADELPPEELAKLAAALNGAAMAMQTAEQYAEFAPYYSGGFYTV